MSECVQSTWVGVAPVCDAFTLSMGSAPIKIIHYYYHSYKVPSRRTINVMKKHSTCNWWLTIQWKIYWGFTQMSPWWSLCTLYSLHARWSYRRWPRSLLLWACVQCHVWCQLFERHYFPLFVASHRGVVNLHCLHLCSPWISRSFSLLQWIPLEYCAWLMNLNLQYGCFFRLVSGAGDIKLTKDGNVLLHEMVRQHSCKQDTVHMLGAVYPFTALPSNYK